MFTSNHTKPKPILTGWSLENVDPDFLKKVEFVREHNLWHYHIGIPSYDLSPNGYSTSQYVLHYIRQEDYIVIVDMSDHSPFELPDQSYLEFILCCRKTTDFRRWI